jgi:cell division protein FtsX
LFLLTLVLPPFAIAFIAQLAAGRSQRHRIRRWIAALWIALLSASASLGDDSGSWIGRFLFALLVVSAAFLIAYFGAWLGSTIALWIKRLAVRPGRAPR